LQVVHVLEGIPTGHFVHLETFHYRGLAADRRRAAGCQLPRLCYRARETDGLESARAKERRFVIQTQASAQHTMTIRPA
jgi:hypothetical protein